jgi:hypothetical protein
MALGRKHELPEDERKRESRKTIVGGKWPIVIVIESTARHIVLTWRETEQEEASAEEKPS